MRASTINSVLAILTALTALPANAQTEIFHGVTVPPANALPDGSLHVRNISQHTLYFFLSVSDNEWVRYRLDSGVGALVRSNRVVIAIETSTEDISQLPPMEPIEVSTPSQIETFDIVPLFPGDRAELCWNQSQTSWVIQTQHARRCPSG